MSRPDDLRRAELLNRACDQARWRLGDERGAELTPLLHRYWARAPLDAVEAHGSDALFAIAFSHWRLGEQRTLSEPAIRVYSPSVDEHGWHSEHTVVEIVTKDMPFLVDSVTAVLNRRDLLVHLVVHPILRSRRDANGALNGLADAGSSEAAAESFMHIEITRQPEADYPAIADDIAVVLADVRAAVTDWRAMRARMTEMVAALDAIPGSRHSDTEEARAFLEWLREKAFTFVGGRSYAVERTEDGDVIRVLPDSGLGILRDPDRPLFETLQDGAPLPPEAAGFLKGDAPVVVTKAHVKSTVHRPVYLDVVAVKHCDDAGQPMGAYLVAGLFSASVYTASVAAIPLLRRTLASLLHRAGFDPRSHDGRALAHVIETFPRDELFQFHEDDLLDVVLRILDLQLRPHVALIVRRDSFERFLSCLVYVPRERYTTQLRLMIHQRLERAFKGTVTAQHLQVGDAALARLHLVIRTEPGRVPPYDPAAIEDDIVTATRSWSDVLLAALLTAHGEEEGRRLYRRYAEAFPPGYRDRFNAEQAIGDITEIEKALASDTPGLALYRPFAATSMQFRFKVYLPDQPLVLSHVLPIIEHFGLRVVDEVPHAIRVRLEKQRTVLIHDLGLETPTGKAVELADIGERFREGFLAAWNGEVESDNLNALVISAGLTIGEVTVPRAYTRYLRQVGVPFTQAYLERVLTGHPEITSGIVRLFMALFDPDGGDEGAVCATQTREAIAAGLETVTSAEDDRILRRFLNLVDSTLRTNYFRHSADGRAPSFLALKLDSTAILELPRPRPMVEVFVYSPRVEGIHLRGGKVARGGIRWSDRREDFRTEVLGLMKAQMVKNAVIVPVGAKGGFVVKRPPAPSDREAWQAEGIACYKTLMRGLLDLTDNLVGGAVVPPPRVLRRDGNDPYLVVAADKGTATFSDIANGVAAEYRFWLDDAFASGGSQGYDHKAMGITARGAWEGVKRHFREMGRDIQSQDFTVVGVGDMSGDVFGNGMLLSRHIRLLAAFDHRHIFVDPDPDPEASFIERQRLFGLPRSSWADYDAALLSPGGAVFSRAAKTLALSPEIRSRFGLAAGRLTPGELIRVLLTSEIDLLWFGGIGTFIKAVDETHGDVGDRVNDAVRVNGQELRCKVIGEGANLGVTQLGRIEYARSGGRINTDFIDNSAGVDCSDHEVNIKILVDAVVDAGDLTAKQRNQLLQEMTDEVADLVLRDNYLQTQAISLIEADAAADLDAQRRLIRTLERHVRLNRAVEFLPDEDALAELEAKGQGLTRPEIAVLFSYAKIGVNEQLLLSDLPDNPYLADDLVHYFPTAIRERLGEWIGRHRLRRELVSTSITNSIINRMGGVFIFDIAEKTGLPVADIARAYVVARHVFAARELWAEIEALDGTIDAVAQTDLNRRVHELLERGTLWFLHNGGSPIDISATLETFSEPMTAIAGALDALLPEGIAQRTAEATENLLGAGVPAALAARVAQLAILPECCDVVRIAAACDRPTDGVARLHYAIGERFGFGTLRERAQSLPATGYWQRLAISAVVEELYAHQRDVTKKVLAISGATHIAAIEAWCAGRKPAIERCSTLLAELEAARALDLSMLAVASRQLRALAES